jgi:hypothetical protein
MRKEDQSMNVVRDLNYRLSIVLHSIRQEILNLDQTCTAVHSTLIAVMGETRKFEGFLNADKTPVQRPDLEPRCATIALGQVREEALEAIGGATMRGYTSTKRVWFAAVQTICYRSTYRAARLALEACPNIVIVPARARRFAFALG